MPYKVLPVLVGTLMFSPTLKALDSKGNLETPRANNPEDISKQDFDHLKEIHDLGDVFDDPHMGSTPYQPVNEIDG
jgi:hypothetical protein